MLQEWKNHFLECLCCETNKLYFLIFKTVAVFDLTVIHHLLHEKRYQPWSWDKQFMISNRSIGGSHHSLSESRVWQTNFHILYFLLVFLCFQLLTYIGALTLNAFFLLILPALKKSKAHNCISIWFYLTPAEHWHMIPTESDNEVQMKHQFV